MKKPLLFLVAILLLNCTTKPDYEEIAIDRVKEGLLDPNSFELIKIEKDTVLLSDILEEKIIKENLIWISYKEMANLHVERGKEWAKLSYMKDHALEEAAEAKIAVDSMTVSADRLTSMENDFKNIKETEHDTIIDFMYMVRGYAMSRGGNKIIGDWYVNFDKNYNFVKISDANNFNE